MYAQQLEIIEVRIQLIVCAGIFVGIQYTLAKYDFLKNSENSNGKEDSNDDKDDE